MSLQVNRNDASLRQSQHQQMPPAGSAAAFSAALASSQLDMSRQVTGAEMPFKSRLKRDKKKAEAIETVAEVSNDEESLLKTVNELSKKLEKLSELERRAAGL